MMENYEQTTQTAHQVNSINNNKRNNTNQDNRAFNLDIDLIQPIELSEDKNFFNSIVNGEFALNNYSQSSEIQIGTKEIYSDKFINMSSSDGDNTTISTLPTDIQQSMSTGSSIIMSPTESNNTNNEESFSNILLESERTEILNSNVLESDNKNITDENNEDKGLVENDEDEEEEEDEDDDEEDNDDDGDDNSDEDCSSNSSFSDLSGLSDMSGKEWKPINQRPLNWVQKQIHSGANPRELLWKILPGTAQRIAPDLNDISLWRLLSNVLSEPPRRQKLSYVNTFDDVIELLQKCNNIIVLTGAGVSVSCGIPDFRSSDGIYARLAKDFPDMPDPQAMFDINYFSRDPRPFYRFAREIYPGQFKPSPCHRFIRMLELKQKLLRNYTQNIDTLEQVAGIKNVIECHGSFSTASCTKCKYKCDANSIREDIFTQHIPVCPRCQPTVKQSVNASEAVSEQDLAQLVENGIMKPDIVFFGEGLPNEFHTVMANDKDKCDLLIVMGSSLKVRPVALIPSSIPNHVPQILINREQLCHLEFDVELLGDGDVIINQVCHRMGGDWHKEICVNDEILTESKELMPIEIPQSMSSYNTNIVPKNMTGSMDESECDTKSNTSSMEPGSRAPSSSTYSDNSRETYLSGDRDYQQPTTNDYRHLSIDLSKDSGINGDNTTTSSISCSGNGNGNLINNSSSFDSTKYLQISVIPSSSPSAITGDVSTNLENDTTTQQHTKTSIVTNEHQTRNLSAGERLYHGTYYHHEGSSSYVFPGAQVSWSADPSEEEEDEEDVQLAIEDIRMNDIINVTSSTTLSPLLTASVEAEMVTAITNTAAGINDTTISTTATTTTNSSTTFSPVKDVKEDGIEDQSLAENNNNNQRLETVLLSSSSSSVSSASNSLAKRNHNYGNLNYNNKEELTNSMSLTTPPFKKLRSLNEVDDD